MTLLSVMVPTVAERADMWAANRPHIETQQGPWGKLRLLVDDSAPAWGDQQALCDKRNRMLAQVRTAYVATFDDDDVMLPGHLHRLWDHLHAHNLDVVLGRAERPPEEAHEGATDPGWASVSAALMRTAAIRKAGGWSFNGQSPDDISSYYAWLALGLRIAVLPDPPSFVRVIGEHRHMPPLVASVSSDPALLNA